MQIEIDKRYDADFIGLKANLLNGVTKSWGTYDVVDPTKQGFAFMSIATDNVEAVIADYDSLYLADAISKKLEALATIRAEKELNGPSGLTLNDKTSIRLNAAAMSFLIDTSKTSLRWEISRGVFITLTKAQVLGLATAAVNHVQACFDNVYTKTQLIKAVVLADSDNPLEDALAELAAIDLTTGWPS